MNFLQPRRANILTITVAQTPMILIALFFLLSTKGSSEVVVEKFQGGPSFYH
jgi:hypothetical protein